MPFIGTIDQRLNNQLKGLSLSGSLIHFLFLHYIISRFTKDNSTVKVRKSSQIGG